MLEAGVIWKAILDRQRESVAGHAAHGIEPQPLPDNLFAVLTHIHNLAAERRPLNLDDYPAFWQDGPQDHFIACNLIHSALEDHRRRPLDTSDRTFLDHWKHCARYLAEQGYQGIEDDRDHWQEVVAGEWPDADNPA